jgi:toxin CcdB
MARFDVYRNPITADRAAFPYVLEIQSNLLSHFVERVCVPLAKPGAFPGMTQRFNPSIDVADKPVFLHPLGIAVFLIPELRKPVAHAQANALEIETALDMLLRGY